MSASAVVRSACRHALRRPLLPHALTAMERPPLRAENWSVRRRFHSSDSSTTTVGKPAETNMATTLEEASISRRFDEAIRSFKFDQIIRSLDEQAKIAELEYEAMLRARGRKLLAATIVAGVLAANYVKRRFFGGASKEEEDNKENATARAGKTI